ncbi:MAG: hypothetical protein HQL84_09895 [Magnetococcales bacterium]|nr:hypothetical protein [Magnetococcales bacterium]MBF0150343.1 hypothetical protein [Magnetococcales bacterium]MBF0173587.1 hypothetical protein [Magnetococcales bacterium]MBF0349270.1 hypothetical protein [Magnetococcales bacterium]MBF0629460.1 hypothetical protein [Magnetococcales bacterium]
MPNRLEKQTHTQFTRSEMPSRFIGILTPAEFGEMVEYGFIRATPENLDNPFETLTEQLLPKINRGRLCDALNTRGCYDQPTFIRLGKRWPQLEKAEFRRMSHQPSEPVFPQAI